MIDIHITCHVILQNKYLIEDQKHKTSVWSDKSLLQIGPNVQHNFWQPNSTTVMVVWLVKCENTKLFVKRQQKSN